jgi:predicted nucleotidyltransferase
MDIVEKIRANKDFLRKKYGVRNLYIVGSFARGEAKEDSDVDIIVEMPSKFDNFFEVKYFLENLLNKKVDLALKKSLRNYIKKRIEKEMIYV